MLILQELEVIGVWYKAVYRTKQPNIPVQYVKFSGIKEIIFLIMYI